MCKENSKIYKYIKVVRREKREAHELNLANELRKSWLRKKKLGRINREETKR